MPFLIKNAFIIDGTGRPGQVGDLLADGERIKSVGQNLHANAATEIVDGEGLTLCPGFIDAHAHSDISILAAPEAYGKISQGVTTEIVGNCGLSAFPVNRNNLEHLQTLYRNYGIEISWSSLSEYAAEINRRQPAVNLMALCGHNTLRAAAAGYEQKLLSAMQQAQMLELLDGALRQGAAGLSSGLLYVPGKFSDSGELCQMLRLLAGFERPYTTHLRSEGTLLLEAIEEAVSACNDSGQRQLHISHFKTAGESNWIKLDAALAAIGQAIDCGICVTADCYPYIESMTQLSIILPEPYDNMDDVTFQKFIADQSNFIQVCARLAEYPACRWQTVRLVSTAAAGMQEFAGMTFEQIATSRQIRPENICAEILKADAAGAMAAFQGMSATNVKRIAAHPFSSCGTDESARPEDYSLGRSHPRGFGSFPEFFALLKDILPIEEIIRKCTALPAAVFGLKARGRIEPDAYADLILFEPMYFNSPADFARPHRPAKGIRAVWVNGRRGYSVNDEHVCRAGRFIAAQ